MPSLSVILCSAFVRPIILSSLVITWKCPSTAIHISYRGCAIHTLYVELQCHTLLPQLRASLLQSSIFFWFVLPDKHADKNDCAQRSDERFCTLWHRLMHTRSVFYSFSPILLARTIIRSAQCFASSYKVREIFNQSSLINLHDSLFSSLFAYNLTREIFAHFQIMLCPPTEILNFST